MKSWLRRLGYVFAGCFIVGIASLSCFPLNIASADLATTGGSAYTCSNTDALCSDATVSDATFVDQNVIQAVFSGHYQAAKGEIVDLSFLNVNNGAADFYDEHADTSGTPIYALDGQSYDGYSGGQCHPTSEQPDLTFFPANQPQLGSLEGGSGQILTSGGDFTADSYKVLLQNINFPDSSVTFSQPGVTAAGNASDSCGDGSNNILHGSDSPQTVNGIQLNGDDLIFSLANQSITGSGSNSIRPGQITYVLNSDGTIFRSDADPNYDNNSGSDGKSSYTFSLDTDSTDIPSTPSGFISQYVSNYPSGNASSNSKCQDVLTITTPSSNGVDAASIATEKNEGNGGDYCNSPQDTTGGATVDVIGDFTKNGSPSTTYSTPASGNGNNGGGNSGAVAPSPSLNCAVHLYNPLSWFLCPLATGLSDVAGALDTAINNILTIDTTSSGLDDYQTAWAAVRDVSLGLIVIAGLAAIIAQAAGFEFLDAYAIRKALPRIVIVAIGISLSWPLMIWFVRLTNDFGLDIRSVIYLAAKTGNGKINVGAGGQYVIGLIGAAGIASLGFVGLLSFAATAALAASVAFLVLTLRQMIIAMLVIFSPFALACYVLPHTQKVWKLWWDSFSKGLLMFPLITGIIAIGRVFAAVNSQQPADGIRQVLAFVGYFAPYFLIPFTFRLAGGAIANIGGFVNDRHSGGFDRMKKLRSGKTQENFKGMQENRRFDPNKKGLIGRVNRGLNTGLSGITTPGASGAVYAGRALNKLGIKNGIGQGNVSHIDQAKMQQTQKFAEKLNQSSFNSEALQKLSTMGAYSHADLEHAAENLEAEGMKQDAGPGRDNYLLAASQLRSNVGLFHKLNENPEMGRANIGAAAGLARISQGFGDTDEYAQVANELGGTSSGFASMFVTAAGLAGQRAGRLDMKPGYGIQVGANGQYIGSVIKDPNEQNISPEERARRINITPGERDRRAAHQVRRILTMNQQELQAAKGPSVEALSPGFQQILRLSDNDFDAQGNHAYTYSDVDPTDANKQIARTVTITKYDRDRVAQMLGTANAAYSSTSPDTARTINNLAQGGMSADALQQFRSVSSREYDPRLQGQPQPPGDPGAAGGGGPGAGPTPPPGGP